MSGRLVERHGLREVPLDTRTVWATAGLPPIYPDRFDRVLVALALAQGLTTLTSDENIAKYPGVQTTW